MDIIDHRERLISLSHDEAKRIMEEEKQLQQYCSEPIDAVLFPTLAHLLQLIEEESHKSW
ncbi:hypothetical protein ES703_56766 [subsurface metagenome]